MSPKSITKITSTKNDSIKRVVRLRDKASKDFIIVEGVREIGRAARGGAAFVELFLYPDLFVSSEAQKLANQITASGAKTFETSKPVFEKISFGERKEGILALCQRPKRTLEHISLRPNPLVVVVESVEKPGNLGAILRTCDGAGVDGLIICDAKVDIFNANVIRASLGTVFSLAVVSAANSQALKFLKDNNIKTFAAVVGASTLYSSADFRQPAAIILGSEDKGLSDFWLENIDVPIGIPMAGQADSLNVSAAAAVIIYEAVRQRGQL